MSDKNPDIPENVEKEEEQVKVPKENEEDLSTSSSGFNFGAGFGSTWLNQGSTWGASFLTSAKEKTLTTFDLVKKDLNDLSEAVSAEMNDLTTAAKEGFGTAAKAVKQQAEMLEKLVTPTEEEVPLPGEESSSVEVTTETQPKKEQSSGLNFGWMTKIVDSVTDTVKNLAMEETTDGEQNFTEAIKPKQIRKTKIKRIKLSEIENSESTFTEEPEKTEFYERWLNRFKLDEYDGEINILLANNPNLRQTFAKLVPAKVDHESFWSRYFYAIDIAELEEEMNNSTLAEALNIDTSKKGKKDSSESSSKKTSPSSDSSGIVVVEPTSPSQSEWSVCSEKNVEEIPSNDEEEETGGPLTPKPKDGEEKREEGWVDWDE